MRARVRSHNYASRPMYTHGIGTSVPRRVGYPRLMIIAPPPMMQLMSTKVIPTLLLSFHVCLTRNHAIFQVRGFVTMSAKHRDGRAQRRMHADDTMRLLAFVHSQA